MASKCRDEEAESISDLIDLQKVFVELASERLKEDPGAVGVLGTYHREIRKLKFLQMKLAALQGIELSRDWDKEEPDSIIPPEKKRTEAIVRDTRGKWVGHVRRSYGKAVLTDRCGQIIAIYDPRRDQTLSVDGNLIGPGNLLVQLIQGRKSA